MLKSKILSAVTILIFAGVCEASVMRSDDGVTVELEPSSPSGTRLVRLKVIGDKIIRVSATPDSAFADPMSLVVLTPTSTPAWSMTQTDSCVYVSTAEVTASVNRFTGQVIFRDRHGRAIVAEEENGRSFKPVEVEDKKGYSVGQSFLSLNDNEAIYGLGQHQADEFNYKGKNEELFQYNTKVSVPFVVSTDGYGILWDSYSLVKWGNPEDYSQLGEVLRLYDKNGVVGALTGTYTDATGATLVRREDSLYFEHLDRNDGLRTVVNLPRDFAFRGSKVVYEGEIEAPVSGEYKFIMYYAGYQSVSVDGRTVVPTRWRTAWNPNAYKFSLNLEAGRRYPLKIEWLPDGDVSYAGLRAYAPVDPAEQLKMRWWSEMQPQQDYYYIYGDNMDDVISGYRTLTGRASVLPKWAMGYWQSRERYSTQSELLEVVAKYRELGIPLDNIVQDWFYWPEDQWGSHEFDATRFPDPKAMVDSVHAMKARIMISVWPKFYCGTEHFREFDERGWMYRLAVTDSIRDWVGPGYVGSFYDAYNAYARRLFWNQMEQHLMPLGFDAWWMDASEPNVRDCTDLQYRKDLITPTALGPSTEYFNAYGLMNAQAIYDGQRAADPRRRVFLLTRSGFAGQQRYSTATWSGDIGTGWEDMKAQISAGLNFSASGIPFWTMDTGGFCVQDRFAEAQRHYDATGEENADLAEWRELNARWFQFGAFAPLFRAHGQWPTREIYNLAPQGHPAYESMVRYTRLRYDLMPYVYTLAGMARFDDYTIMRPVAMDFASDTATHALSDQYMFGPWLMVAPVYTYGARSRHVYLPPAAGGWYDLYSGTSVTPGHLDAPAPYVTMPLYVRAGAILPMGPDINSTAEASAGDPLTLFVYTGADGEFRIYDDDGLTYDYEQGAYERIPVAWNDADRTLAIGRRQGAYPGMGVERQFSIVVVNPDSPCPFDRAAEPAATVTYTGQPISIQL